MDHQLMDIAMPLDPTSFDEKEFWGTERNLIILTQKEKIEVIKALGFFFQRRLT